MAEVWVPVLDRADDDPTCRYEPDLPADVPFRCLGGVPLDLNRSDPAAWKQRLVNHALLQVRNADAVRPDVQAKIVQEADVPLIDRLIIQMIRIAGSRRLPGFEDRVRAFFESIKPLITTPARQEMAVRMIRQMMYRGLSAARALQIAQYLGITEVEP